jgi:hypothetical protein
MTNRLLDRQTSLLEYLTSGGAIFGDRDEFSDEALAGIDHGLLRLEARLSHQKRMEKISTVLPRTFELLGSDQARIVREFVEVCPPVETSRLENARQFHGFLSARWQRELPEPRYLPYIPAFELACAEVRSRAQELRPEVEKRKETQPRNVIRRQPGVILLRCAYDIRPIFETGCARAVPAERDTSLVIVMPAGADHPRIFEVLPMMFDTLAALDDWTDPDSVNVTSQLEEFMQDLTKHGLVEVCR